MKGRGGLDYAGVSEVMGEGGESEVMGEGGVSGEKLGRGWEDSKWNGGDDLV